MCYRTTCALVAFCCLTATALAQDVLFTFDDLPAMRPLPQDTMVGGITAHLTGTGQSYSIQQVGTLGIAPTGMSGNYIFPSSVYASDLLIGFSRKLLGFSIMYAPQELMTDSSCTMRVTAYMDSAFVGTNTYQVTTEPYLWPTGVLSINTAKPFNRVVVHYEKPPPTGGDYGVIFVADNMVVSPAPTPSTTITGTVTLSDYGGAVSEQWLIVDLLQGGIVVERQHVPLDSAGQYSFTTTTTSGTTTVRLEASHWLARAVGTFDLEGAGISADAVLINGDVDGDNAVTVFDYNLLSAAFDSAPGDANWLEAADLDGDGLVTVYDYNILSANFDLVGD